MEPIKNVANELKLQGKTVEILDDAYLAGRKFHLDAYDAVLSDGTKVHYPAKDWTVSEAWDDMVNNDAYRFIKDDVTKYIVKHEDIIQIPMYKLDEIWIKSMKSEGYDILNIGNPLNEAITPSKPAFFFELEKNIMNW